MQGLHILAELHDCACARELLHRPEQLQALCQDACRDAGLSIVAAAFHGFGSREQPAGATGAIVLAESHLAVHTWPEIGRTGAVTLDLYVCNFSRNNHASAEHAFTHLVNAFHPDRVERQDIQRGALNASPQSPMLRV